MNIQNKYMSLGKSILSCTLCAGVLSASMGVQAEVSQVPLGLSEGVPPNMLFTLDDSTSMAWAYVPDATADAYDELIGNSNNRRFRAANTNPMYYNPNVVYDIPPEFDSSGNELIGINKKLKTSFASAPVNGYRPENGSVNLSEDYEVVREHKIPNTGYSTADHPFQTDISCSVNIDRFNTGTCKINNTNISVRRTDWYSCDSINPTSVKLNIEGEEILSDLSCSISNWRGPVTITGKVPAYYYEFDGSLDGGTCAAKKNNDDAGGENCYRLRWVNENSAYDKTGTRLKNADGSAVDGRQNFANWYSFYKTRALATVSAAGIAFYDLSPNVRFTWQSLINCKVLDSGTGKCGLNNFRPYSRSHKTNFYNWLYTNTYFNDAQGTQLRSALQRSGKFLEGEKAWLKDPTKNAGNQDSSPYACRPSYNVIMTDGMWNTNGDREVVTSISNTDESMTAADGSVISSSYKKAPYYDATKNTLADFAMHYWATDLRAGLADKIPAYIPYKNTSDSDAEYWDPRNNPATWQHMSNFIMGLGLTNSLSNNNIPWVGNTFSGEGYNKLKAGTVSWPAAADGSDNNVYDLWHAAINSRGEFYSVDSPDAMVQAFKDILTRIADRKSSAAAPGTSTSLESDGAEEDAADRLASYFYQTSFDSGDGWAGDIKKVKKYRKYNKDKNTFEDVVEEGWSAKERMPSANSRKIWIAGGGASKLKAFSTTNAGDPDAVGSLASYLKVNPEPGTQVATWQQRLEYLRGSKENEGDAAGKLRPRSSILGDFLASQPVIVSGARYLEGFANRLESPETGAPTTTYSTFMASIANRRGQLYVGGNDGMLHAFDTATGEEKFAFIPTVVFPKLNKLTGKNYTHEYYVDGTPVIADVYDGTNWRTILVGTLRAGGKGLFALDITNPDDIQLLWEFGENSITGKDAVKPGYSFPQPTVARLHNGKWAVVTGNGYKGAGTSNGAAALYVIDAINGEIISNLKVQSPNTDGGENGLSSPRLADYDSDGVADYAYAGDLHGNLWRFDLLGAGATAPTITPPTNGSYGGKTGATTKFAVSYGGKPMFTATSTTDKRQSITSAPSLVRHPTRKGYLVMFGTGKYFELGDKTGEVGHAQTLYGIWDMKTKAEATTVDIISRTSLAVQTLGADTTGVGVISKKTRGARTVSSLPVEWYQDFDSSKPVVKRGWRLDLRPSTGEMIIENMDTFGSMLLFKTLVPNDDPCANGSTFWQYAIDPATGGKTLHHAFDTRAKDANGKDVIVSAIKVESEGGVSINRDEKNFKVGDEITFPSPPSSGRQSWRMVPDA